MPASKPFTVGPKNGGKLMSDVSANEAGIANFRVNRDWRRFLDRQIRREGHELYQPNPAGDPTTQCLDAPEPINGLFLGEAANGDQADIATTPTTLWRYVGLVDGTYVSPVISFLYFDPNDPNSPYFDPGDPNSPYVVESTVSEPYFSSDYVEDFAQEWVKIGDGYSPNGSRWEVEQVGDDIVFNNGFDLPVSYRLVDLEVTPLYELRERGVASVGSITSFNDVLMLHDIRQIKSTDVNAIANPIEQMGTASQVGATTSGGSLAEQDGLSYVVNITSGSFVFNAGMVGKIFLFRNGFRGNITAYNSPTQILLDNAPVWTPGFFSDYDSWNAVPVTQDDNPPPPPPQVYVPGSAGNVSQLFLILNTDNSNYIVTATNPVFDDTMVGLHIYWDSGDVREIVQVIDSMTVVVDTYYAVASGTYAIENPQSYGPITDPTLVDDFGFRTTWSALGMGTRYAPSFPCAISAGSRILTLTRPAKSLTSGMSVIVVGAALDGGNLTATILVADEGSKTFILDTAATTTVTNGLVAAADTFGGIGGLFQDLQQDGTPIIRSMQLNDVLNVYRGTGYQVANYTGDVTAPFQFTPIIKTANTLFYKYSLTNVSFRGNNFHLFAGRNALYRLDQINRLPNLLEGGEECLNIFYDQAAMGETFLGPEQVPQNRQPPAPPATMIVIPVFPGVTYYFDPLVSGDRAFNGSTINGPTLPTGSFVAAENVVTLLWNGQTATTSSLKRVFQYADYVFGADNTITHEVFLCFPSTTQDYGLALNYDTGTLSTIGSPYTAGVAGIRPDSPGLTGRETWFLLGNMQGQVLTYGRCDINQARWNNGMVLYTRNGQPYTSEMYHGLGDFGQSNYEKIFHSYTLQLSSQSPDATATVELYGAKNPNSQKVAGLNGERLLSSRTFTQLDSHNFWPLYYAAHYLSDRILVSGTGACEVVARTFDINLVRSSGVTRLSHA